jgi:hypothetical protein
LRGKVLGLGEIPSKNLLVMIVGGCDVVHCVLFFAIRGTGLFARVCIFQYIHFQLLNSCLCFLFHFTIVRRVCTRRRKVLLQVARNLLIDRRPMRRFADIKIRDLI